jgi:hypothetical protein
MSPHDELPERVATLEAKMHANTEALKVIGGTIIELQRDIKPALTEVALQGQAIRDLQGRPGVLATWIVAGASVLMALGAVGWSAFRAPPPTPPSAVEIAQELARLQIPAGRR